MLDIIAFFTILGGLAAIYYFYEKFWRHDEKPPIEVKQVVVEESEENLDLRTVIQRRILKAAHFVNSNNRDPKKGIWIRHLPSVMETCNALNAVIMASLVIETFKPFDIERPLNWSITKLKEAFKQRINGEKVEVEFFDCNYKQCQFSNRCNFMFFDYLSHFYYIKDHELLSNFQNDFGFVRDFLVATQKIDGGWSIIESYEGEKFDSDPLTTATTLILLVGLGEDSNSKTIRDAENFLIREQVQKGKWRGGWKRPTSDIEIAQGCMSQFWIITAHRALEALKLLNSTENTATINAGIQFLKNIGVPWKEKPTVYYEKYGSAQENMIRGTGHAIQAFTKCDDTLYFDHIVQPLKWILSPRS